MSFIMDQLAKPLLRRLGAVLAGYLIAKGVPEGDVDAVVNGVSVCGALAIDLLGSYLARRGR